MIGQCEVCGRMFEGEDREEIIQQWSKHNDRVHRDVLQSNNKCCTLNFNQRTFATEEQIALANKEEEEDEEGEIEVKETPKVAPEEIYENNEEPTDEELRRIEEEGVLD